MRNTLILSVTKKHVGGMYHALQSVKRSLKTFGIESMLIENVSFFEYLKIFRSKKKHIIIWSLSHEASLLPLITSHIIGKKNVYFNHGVWHLESQVSTWYELGPLSSLKRKIHYLVLQLKQFMMLLFVSEVIHPSEYASQLFWNQKLNRVLIASKKSVVLPLSVDRRKFTIKSLSIRKKIKNKYGISSISKVILMLGRADNRKNIQDGLLVAKNLLKTRNNIQFLFVFATSEYSDYSYVSYLSKKIDELHIGKNVKLITGLSVEEIPEVYQIADVFLVLPIHSEMFGLTTLESLYSGTPVFGYHSAATPEIIRESTNKYLVSAGCINDLAAKVENYLYSTSEKDQEKTRKEISKNAMRNFNDVKIAEELRKYFSL